MPVTEKNELVRVEAPGLLLRGYEPTDAADLLAAFADEDIARWNPGPDGPESAASFMASRNDWTGNHASWAVADTSDRLIGSVSLHKIDPDQAEELGLHRVYLYHAVENPGSCGVARSAAFVHEGTLRQSYRYADGVYHDEHLHALLSTDVDVG